MRVKLALTGLGTLLAARAVQAHEVVGLAPHSLWQAWNDRAWLWALFLLSGALVLRGLRALWRNARPGAGIRRWQAASFGLGWILLGVSMLSPLDALGEELFWAHMLQHELMMLVAAPLLVLGRPLAAMIWGLPPRWRPATAAAVAGMGLKAAVRVLCRPLMAWWVHAAVLWGWHAPMLFSTALRVPWVHDLQHLSFFVSALLFWWALFQGRPANYGGAVAYVFTTAVHTSVLGALLAFSERVLYPAYETSAPHWGLSALEDQQLGGLIMWVPGGVVYLVVALALFAAWLQASERAAPVPQMEARG